MSKQALDPEDLVFTMEHTGWPLTMHGMRGVMVGSELGHDGTPFIVRVSSYDVWVVFLAGPLAGDKVHYSWLRSASNDSYPTLTPAPEVT